MKLLYAFAQFLISEWLWAFTFGFYHPMINIVIMIPLFVYSARQRFVQAVLYAVGSQLCALVSFSLFVHLILDLMLGVQFESYDARMIMHPFISSFLLGSVYALLQLAYFYLLSFIYTIPIKLFARIVFISNIITALLIFRFLPIL